MVLDSILLTWERETKSIMENWQIWAKGNNWM